MEAHYGNITLIPSSSLISLGVYSLHQYTTHKNTRNKEHYDAIWHNIDTHPSRIRHI